MKKAGDTKTANLGTMSWHLSISSTTGSRGPTDLLGAFSGMLLWLFSIPMSQRCSETLRV